MSGFVEVSFSGEKGIHDMLGKFMEPELTKRALRATKAGARVLQEPLKAAVTPLSRRMGRSVYIHTAKRDKPAFVVGHHRRTAFFWHMVIGGTKGHSLTSRKTGRSGPTVRGVAAHPVMGAIVDRHGDAAYQAIVNDLSKES
jgi:hypothetical protein